MLSCHSIACMLKRPNVRTSQIQRCARRLNSRMIVACLLVLTLNSGCQSSPFSGGFTHALGFREANSARENPADQMSDPWIQDVGKITSGEHAAQEVNDPLKLRNFFMSEKAQDIERNLGIGR